MPPLIHKIPISTRNYAITLQSASNCCANASLRLKSTAQLLQNSSSFFKATTSVADMRNDLKTALLKLAHESDKRSVTARVNDHFAEIEAALNAGVQRTAVLETLALHGISLSLKNFDNILYRLRKKQLVNPSKNENAIPSNLAPNEPEPKGSPPTMSNPISEASPRQSESKGVVLPDDWMAAKLTPAQFRLLSPKQSRAKIDAETAQFFPNRFKPSVSDS